MQKSGNGDNISMKLHKLLERYGKLFSQELGIDVKKEPFKWFLASILFWGKDFYNYCQKDLQGL